MESFRSRTLSIFDILIVVVLFSLCPSAHAHNIGGRQQISRSSWCSLSQIDDHGLNDWAKIPQSAVHVVRASKQASAMKTLSKTTLFRLADGEIMQYLKDGEKTYGGKFLYLVRAAAFYVDDNYRLPKPAFEKLPLYVSYSSSRDILLIVDYALGHDKIKPSNFVLAIEAPKPIGQSEAVCLRTQ